MTKVLWHMFDQPQKAEQWHLEQQCPHKIQCWGSSEISNKPQAYHRETVWSQPGCSWQCPLSPLQMATRGPHETNYIILAQLFESTSKTY